MALEMTEAGTAARSEAWRLYAAVGFIFLLLGAAFGTWVSRIPAVQKNTGLSTGYLGLAMVCGSLAGMAAMWASGRLSERYGTRRVTRAGIVILCLTLPLPALATGFAGLAAALVAFSGGFGIMEVGVNAEALRLEEILGRRVMSSLHGLFSVGGMVGAAAGGWAAAHGVPAAWQFAAAGAFLLATGAIAGGYLPPEGPPHRTDTDTAAPARRLSRRAFLLGLVALSALIAEGAMGDWTALYLVRMLDSGPGVAALGFAAFSFSMAAARLMGDVAARAFGAMAAVRAGATLAAVALAVALASPWPWAAIVGFGCVGIGLAVVVPLVYSAAGRLPGGAPGRSIAHVATVGSFGFLVGPPTIGFVAEGTSLRVALALLIPLCAVIITLSGQLDSGRLDVDP